MNASTDLQKRVITGLVGGTGLLALVLLGGWIGIFVLSTVLSLGMIYEFTAITFTTADRIEKRYVLFSLNWFLSLLNVIAPQSEFQLLVFSFIFLFTYFLVTARRHSGALLGVHFKELTYSNFALIYLIFVPLYFSKIFEFASGARWIVLFFLIVWASDSGSYFAGKRYGKRKIYPKISPQKTVEGALGGVVAGVIITCLFKVFLFKGMSWVAAGVLPLIVASVAQVGDLCESFLKRAFNVKDSGSVLPGHGGFLDRFDGVVFSLPVMYACIRVFS